MLKGMLGTKLGMTQIFTAEGTVVPVSVVAVGPCRVVQVRIPERDGYSAVQLGYRPGKEKSLNRPKLGHLKRWQSEGTSFQVLREFRVEKSAEFSPGQEIKVGDMFKAEDYLDVGGITKGKGFQGVVKRHGFRGGPASHGQSDRLRAPGSIGSSSFPSRVFKGMRMAGHMGTNWSVVQHLQVVKVDNEQNLLLIKGAVPGNKGNLLVIEKTIKPVYKKAKPAPAAPKAAKKEKPTKKEKATKTEGK